jgi:hypothetical protein
MGKKIYKHPSKQVKLDTVSSASISERRGGASRTTWLQKLLPYWLYESLRLLGFRPFVKGGILLWLAYALFWPEPETSPLSATKIPQPDPVAPQAEVASEDLRPLMTATQTAFYWNSFQWMMSYGKELTPKAFSNKVLYVRYVKEKPIENEKKLTCRPYTEQIILAGKSNTRRGLACQRPSLDWCRQEKGKNAECRLVEPSGSFAKFSTDYDITVHNAKVDWDSTLYRFGL